MVTVWPNGNLLILLGFEAPEAGIFTSSDYLRALNFAQNVNMFALVLYISTQKSR
jgi:hypothetical protein